MSTLILARVILFLGFPPALAGTYHIWYKHPVESLRWDIEYYQTATGSVPVAEFVDSLSPQAKAKFIRSLEMLEEYGLLLREPWVRNIQNIAKLRELRFTSFGEIYRFFFFPVSGRKLILLHGFKKKTQETPKRELRTAEGRMKDYFQRHGGKP